MISILYPISNLYLDQLRLKAFNQSLEQLDDRFNIVISDTGKKSSKPYIETDKKFNYVWEANDQNLFNKSRTINNGFDLLLDDLFIILDAEIIMHPNLYDALLKLDFLDDEFMGITKHLHCNRLYKEKTYNELLPILLKDDSVTVHDFKPGRFIFTNKKTFINIGKFDESYVGYGCHDKKFISDFLCKNEKNKLKNLDIYDIHIFHDNKRNITEKDIHEINLLKIRRFQIKNNIDLLYYNFGELIKI